MRRRPEEAGGVDRCGGALQGWPVLSYLRIRGLALLDDVTLELAPGMNVLTGETGAGKSIIVDALALVRGARGRAELVREGAEALRVDAHFDLGGEGARLVDAALAERGLPPLGDDGLVVRRRVPRAGGGRSFVQGELVTKGVLGEVVEPLVDICSQHEHHGLTRVARHRELLDAHAGLGDRVQVCARAVAAYERARRALEDLRARAGRAHERVEYLRFQLEEIERVAPRPGEYAELRARLTLLRDAQRWAELAHALREDLYEADGAVVERLGAFVRAAEAGAEASSRLSEIAELLAGAQAACEDAAELARHLGQEIEADPGELDRVQERLFELDTLRRKHGDLDEAAQQAAQMRAELAELEHADESLERLAGEAERLRVEALDHARRLHRARARAARKLARALEAELSDLHMPGARVEVRVEAGGEGELGPHGIDQVEFLFSANPGEPTAPLVKVASGGELSRVLLAIKGVLSTGGVATFVFDEVDAGVGGAVAEAIGRRLAQAARAHQVLCITHLPQIAACADAHFRVEKVEQGGRTVTRVRRLSQAERVDELARMMAGARVTASARAHARALLGAAG